MTTRGLSWLHIDDPRSDSHVPSDTSGNPARPASRWGVGTCNGSCRDATSLHELLPEWAKVPSLCICVKPSSVRFLDQGSWCVYLPTEDSPYSPYSPYPIIGLFRIFPVSGVFRRLCGDSDGQGWCWWEVQLVPECPCDLFFYVDHIQ